jgi:hypothetical protein
VGNERRELVQQGVNCCCHFLGALLPLPSDMALFVPRCRALVEVTRDKQNKRSVLDPSKVKRAMGLVDESFRTNDQQVSIRHNSCVCF